METVERSITTAGTVVLDRYALREQLGAGGFGTVWLAHDERLDREVAVKRIPIRTHPSHAPVAARAQREALAAARLSHPSIVALYEAGSDDDAVYLVSELVRGATMGELLADGVLSDRDVLRIGVALCDALAHAHAHGVVHRDVKPGNVLVPEAGQGTAAKLTDFGIARMAGDDALTVTGDVVGTIAYMAPEQADGRGATAASDLYAAALVLYEGLAGVNPIRRAGAAATARRVGTRLPPLRRLRRDLPRRLCAALDAALLPDPALRGSIPALREALAAELSHADDEPGRVDASRWDALATQTVSLRDATERFGRRAGVRDADRHADDEFAASSARPRAEDAADHDILRPGSVHVALGGRVASGALTAGVAAACLPLTNGGPVLDPVIAAAAGGLVVALLPRIGWLLAAAALSVWLVVGSAPGPALIVAAATLPVVLLVPRRPAWWSAPAIAIALGAAGVGGAFPAVAGRARGLATRAACGALGWWWLSLAELVRHQRLLTGPLGDATGGAAGARAGLTDVLGTGTVAIGGLWAAAAMVLPLLVRGRSAAADLAAATIWAVAVALGTRAVAHAAHAGEPRGLVAGAALGALAAVIAGALARAD